MNLSDTKECSHLCVFCLRKACAFRNSNILKDNLLKFNAFTNMLDRFVGFATKEREKLVQQLDIECILLSCCNDCLILINGFCEVYHQFKCLELELEWKIWKLVRIMTLANKVPSRITQLNDVLGRSNDAKALRLEIIEKCNKKLARSLPRVLLKNNKSLVPTSINATNVFTNVNVNNEPIDYESFTEFQLEENLDAFFDDNNDDEIREKIDIVQNKTNPVENTNNLSTQEPNSIPTFPPSLIFENVVLPTLPVLKSEPQNEPETIIPSTSKQIKIETLGSIPSSPMTTKLRYNLRQKRKRNYFQENPNKKYSPNHNPASSSSETSDDTDSEDMETKSKRNPKTNPHRTMTCKLDDCNKRFRNETTYQNHLSLHSNGLFPCKFCSIVETNLIKLSNHEYKTHSKTQKNSTISTNYTNGFTCPRCPFKAMYSSDYQSHFAHTHFSIGIPPPNRREFLKCEICNKKIWDKLKDHHFKTWHNATSEDTNLKTCKMEGCSAYFLRDSQLQSHYQKEHEENQTIKQEQQSTFQCHICLKKYPNRLHLNRHKRLFHKVRGRQTLSTTLPTLITNITQFPCKFCPTVKDTPNELATHEAESHSISETKGTSKKPNRCPRCPYKYLARGSYIKHFFATHLNLLKDGSSSAVCKLCSGGKFYRLNSEKHFKTFHQIKEGMEPQKCDKCEAYFRKPFQLQMHNIRVHEQENECKFCMNRYKTRTGLVTHIQIMHGGKDENPDLPFGCELDECKKRFETIAELEHHQKYGHFKCGLRYERKNKFICGKCKDGKVFGTGTSLQRHLALVHQVRPFVCEECGKAFKTSNVLVTHMVFHKGPEGWQWECGECGKKCATKQKWEEHGRTHTKEKPFVCQFCGEMYAHRHNWRGHLKAKHGEEDGVSEEIGKGGKSRKGNYAKRKGSKKGDCIMAK